jgi:PKD repeat protein
VIDPVISYATYLGGGGNDIAEEIVVDPQGAAYVSGTTYSPNYPTTASAFQRGPKGVANIFITKLDPQGRVVFSTYLGGSYYDNNAGVGVDGQGNVYVAGTTDSPDFPTSVNALQPTDPALDYNHGYFSELSPDGSNLVYSTYLGGSQTDRVGALFVRSDGTAYMTGDTRSTNFPTKNAMQPTNAGGYFDSFVTKLTPDHQLAFSTYLGGSADDEGGAIQVDGAGSVYVTGATNSDNFNLKTPIQPWAGNFDAFVSKLDSAGGLVYSTYVGGRGEDTGGGIGVDSTGSAYIDGQTTSTDLPTVNAYQPTNHGAHDAYVAKLAPNGRSLVYSTYLGGTADDHAGFIAVDRGTGAVYLTGNTASDDFPVLNAVSSTRRGSPDAFVTKLQPSGALGYSTYLGGGAVTSGNAITIDDAGSAYVAGETTSSDFPTRNPAQPTSGGADDAFVVKLSDTTSTPPPPPPPPTDTPPAASFTFTPKSPSTSEQVAFDASASTGTIASYSWWFDDGGGAVGKTAQHAYSAAGSYTAVLTVTDTKGRTSRTGRSIVVGAAAPPGPPGPGNPPPSQSPPAASFTFSPGAPFAGQPVTFDGSGSTGSVVSYSWWFDDGTGGSGVKPQHTYATAGSYSPILTVTDSSGRKSSTGRSVTVGSGSPPPGGPPPPGQSPPVAAFTFTPRSPSTSEQISFDASDSTGSIVSYSWWFDDGGGAVGKTAQHAYSAAGSYTAILTVTDSTGRTSRTGRSLTVR